VTPSGPDNRELARISEQLEELKRLMIVQLLASGVQSAHIAKALGMHPSGISRIVPAREVQKVASKRGARSAESDG
jgi:IS30 family transposase